MARVLPPSGPFVPPPRGGLDFNTSSGPSTADNPGLFQTQARAAYDWCISTLNYTQAIWYAEQLIAESPDNLMNKYLLGLAHYHNGDYSRCYYYLKGNTLPEARYLRAKCCFSLEKWDEAEELLQAGGM